MAGKPKKNISASRPRAIPVVPAPATSILESMHRWGPAVILILTALVYSRVLFNDFVRYDDDTFIINNPLVTASGWDGITNLFTTIRNGKYQPLVTLTYLLEYRTFGFDPVGFHVVSVLLHMVTTWVIFKFTEKLAGSAVTAAVVSVLFALHPMHVEEVAWASELKDVLHAVFYALALLYYMRYRESGYKWKHYGITSLFFLASLFSKLSAVTIPVVLLMIDIYKGRKMDARAWLEKVPMLLLSSFFWILGIMSQHADAALGKLPDAVSVINRIFLFTSVPSFYIIKFIVPIGLSATHYYPQVHNGLLPWLYYASMPFFLLIIWLVARRTAFRRDLVFGMSFFLITVCVMEQIVSVGPALTPERYTYIPYIGFSYIAGQWLSKLLDGKWRNMAIGVFSAFLILFCGLTWARIGAWKDTHSIFGDLIEKHPGDPNTYYPYFVLANVLNDEGNAKEAISYFNESLALWPDNPEAYNNRGLVFFQLGDIKSALVDLNNAIRLDPKKASTYNNRASVKASLGDFKGAISDYDHFLAMDSTNARAYSDRGMTRLNLGDAPGACDDFKRSLKYGSKEAAQLLGQYCH
jgi:protein O-mannosyl-transferase